MTETTLSLPADAPSLGDRVVLLCGATGGLAEAVALAAGAAGAQLILAGRQVVKLEKLADRIEGAGGADPILYPVDLAGAKAEDYEQMAAAIGRECGGLDAIVHCAAEFGGLTPLAHLGEERFTRTLGVTLSARFLIDQACYGLLRERQGRIIHVLDNAAQVGKAYWGSYSVAQFGLRGLLAVEAAEQDSEGVAVVGFQPPPLRTRLRAVAFVSEEMASAADPAAVARGLLTLLDPTRQDLTPGAIYRFET
ncbi:MAG: SDR family NAD(P)-dependent oxidoreductase [Pseudomonadota bacterium]